MVNLVEDWEAMEEYSGQVKHGSYQTTATDGIIEVCVQLGKFGFIKEFKDDSDPLFSRFAYPIENRESARAGRYDSSKCFDETA